MTTILSRLSLVLIVLGVLVPAQAVAQAPANDNRAAAQELDLPATVDGTTVGATVEPQEPACNGAAEGEGSVWYRVRTDRAGRLIVTVEARGDLDARVEVFRVQRSQVGAASCDTTNSKGRSAQSFDVGRGQEHLVRIAALPNSARDAFRLSVQLGEPSATPPGAPLPAGGASGTLERGLDPDVAYSVRLVAGRSYRINYATRTCAALALYPPGTTDFNEARPVASRGCGGYLVFTPDVGQSGTYVLRASASTRQSSTPYRLTAGRAAADDTAPGRVIGNGATARGRLNSFGLDVVDLYRFDVTRRSRLELSLTGGDGFTVSLLSASGRRIGRATGTLTRRVRPGRFFAVVRAGRSSRGAYRLTRLARAITRTRALVNEEQRAKVLPGGSVTLGAQIRPGAPGRVTLLLQRFDPLQGWVFARSFRVRANASGSAAVSIPTPAVGRWRVRAIYNGNRTASPSSSTRFATFRVERPLEE